MVERVPVKHFVGGSTPSLAAIRPATQEGDTDMAKEPTYKAKIIAILEGKVEAKTADLVDINAQIDRCEIEKSSCADSINTLQEAIQEIEDTPQVNRNTLPDPDAE